MIPIFLFALVTLAILGQVVQSFPVTKKFDECDQWAQVDGECLNNPDFMWSSCHTSCMEFAKNDDERCEGWAAEGECSNNPHYIQLHCPESCSFAAGWNPWQRRVIGLTDSLPEAPLEEPATIDSILIAANVMYERISHYLDGGSLSTFGLVSSAPSEYLGLMGLTEAVIYTLRLYKVITQEHILAHEKASAEDTEVLTRFQDMMRHINAVQDIVLEVVGSGWSSDPLQRYLPRWRRDLFEIAKEINDLLSNERVQEALPAVSLSVHEVSKHFQLLADDVPHPKADISVATSKKLSNNVIMPSIGLGTWQLELADCELAVLHALELGYRHLDTAQAYGNEASVGWGLKHAIEKNITTRAEVFIATKLSDESFAGTEKTTALVRHQLELLKVEYIDLYMLHSPIRDNALQAETWAALEALYEEGVIKALGVSNFNHHELKALYDSAAKVKPMVLQNKADVYHPGKQLDNQGDRVLEYAKSMGIEVVAYSSFSAYPFAMTPIDDPIVMFVANNFGTRTQLRVTPGQIVLRWLMQHGLNVIPRSTNVQRLKENFDASTESMPPLNSQEMKLLDSLQFLVESPVSIGVPLP